MWCSSLPLYQSREKDIHIEQPLPQRSVSSVDCTRTSSLRSFLLTDELARSLGCWFQVHDVKKSTTSVWASLPFYVYLPFFVLPWTSLTMMATGLGHGNLFESPPLLGTFGGSGRSTFCRGTKVVTVIIAIFSFWSRKKIWGPRQGELPMEDLTNMIRYEVGKNLAKAISAITRKEQQPWKNESENLRSWLLFPHLATVWSITEKRAPRGAIH